MVGSYSIGRWIDLALEFSVYLAPLDVGLTLEELVIVGAQFHLQEGEILDAAKTMSRRAALLGGRLLPSDTTKATMCYLNMVLGEPEFRNVEAFDFVWIKLQELVRRETRAGARVDRKVLVEWSRSAGLRERDVEAAISTWKLGHHLEEENGELRLGVSAHFDGNTPKQQRAEALRNPEKDNPIRRRTYDAVADVLERRTDTRPSHPEPLEAFADSLSALGYASFRSWWLQECRALRNANPSSDPVGVAVHAAALVEGALTFIVTHARKLQIGPFLSKDFDGDARTWKIEKLVKSASTGQEHAVYDAATCDRADRLILARNRIHAGKMLSEHPQGPEDLKPEEARDAIATAEFIVRRVIEWLAKHSAPQT